MYMSSFSASGLTNKGRALQAKAQAGAQLIYTKAVAGDGTLGNQSIGPLTNVLSPKQTYELTRFKTTGNMATIGFDISNQDVTTGFYFREIGIFATDPDEGEILYWYANSGNTADYIPPGGGSDIIEKTFDVLVFVGTATNVSAVLNSSNIYVTTEELDEAIQTAKDYTDEKFSQIIIQDASLTQKGVVQLSNSTTSTSQTLAATPKAVNDARVAAISAADTAAKSYVDAKTWQKHKLTNDNGFTFDISGQDIHTTRPTGLYAGNNITNAPPNQQVNIFYFYEVLRSGNLYATINAYPLNQSSGFSFYQKRQIGGVWGAWSSDLFQAETNAKTYSDGLVGSLANLQTSAKGSAVAAINEVFQSGVDAKQGVVNAINAKGGSASMNDTWGTLAAKINAIQTGPKYATGTAVRSNTQNQFTMTGGSIDYSRYTVTVTGLTFHPNRILVHVQNGNERYTTVVYDSGSINITGNGTVALISGNERNTFIMYETGPKVGGVTDAWVSNNGFQVPMYSTQSDRVITWEAFQV